MPDKKGRGESGASKIFTEVGVNMATPLGRIKGEMPRSEWDKAESGRK